MQGYVQLQSVRLPAAEDEEGVSDDQADEGEDARGQKPKKQPILNSSTHLTSRTFFQMARVCNDGDERVVEPLTY